MCGFFYWCYLYFRSNFFWKVFCVKYLHYIRINRLIKGKYLGYVLLDCYITFITSVIGFGGLSPSWAAYVAGVSIDFCLVHRSVCCLVH